MFLLEYKSENAIVFLLKVKKMMFTKNLKTVLGKNLRKYNFCGLLFRNLVWIPFGLYFKK